MCGQALLEHHHARDRVDEHVTHRAAVLCVGIDVLYTTQTRVRVAELVPLADDLQDVCNQVGDLELLGHQV